MRRRVSLAEGGKGGGEAGAAPPHLCHELGLPLGKIKATARSAGQHVQVGTPLGVTPRSLESEKEGDSAEMAL